MTEKKPEARPHVPPAQLADLPSVAGAIGPAPEDFEVDELPLYEPSGEGPHLYVRIRKRGVTTVDAVDAIAHAAAVRARDVGYAGLKDKHAVTTQWLSLPEQAADPSAWAMPEAIELLEVSRHRNKLRTGHQRGNRFRLRLVGCSEGDEARARALIERIAERGLANYYGAQRFGYGGHNLARALEWLRRGARSRGKKARLHQNLYPSVIQSEVFNRYVTARLAAGLDALLDGEVVRLEGSGSMFVVDDPEAEAERYLARDLHPTGPMPGPKMKQAERAAAGLEAKSLTEAGLDEADLATLARLAPGGRRDVLVRPERTSVSAVDGALVLTFELPSGSYATEVVRALTGRALFDDLRAKP